MAGLMIQNLSRELFSIANDNDGKLRKSAWYLLRRIRYDAAFDVLPLFPQAEAVS